MSLFGYWIPRFAVENELQGDASYQQIKAHITSAVADNNHQEAINRAFELFDAYDDAEWSIFNRWMNNTLFGLEGLAWGLFSGGVLAIATQQIMTVVLFIYCCITSIMLSGLLKIYCNKLAVSMGQTYNQRAKRFVPRALKWFGLRLKINFKSA